MSIIKIPNHRIGTTEIARIFNTTRQTTCRWCLTGLFATARMDTLAGLRGWTVELWDVLLFTRPGLGRRAKTQRGGFAVPSLSEEQIREYVAGLEV